MKRFFEISDELVRTVPFGYRRFLYDEISLDSRLAGIIGPRGVGKSTLLLQLARRFRDDFERIVYLSLDHPYFMRTSLLSFAEKFALQGGGLLLLDEADKYSMLLTELQKLQDLFPTLHIVFAASSVGDEEGMIYDLSRISNLFYLPGLSFKEYLEWQSGLSFPSIPFVDIIDFNKMPGASVWNRIRPLQYFDHYLKRGYYPFAGTSQLESDWNALRIVNQSIQEDVHTAYRIDFSSVGKMKKVLDLIAQKGSFKPHIENLAKEFGTTRDSLLKFLKYLNKAGLISMLTKGNEDLKYSNKPEEILFNSSNLMYALSTQEPNPQYVMEAFIVNQMKHSHQIAKLGPARYLIDLDWELALPWAVPIKKGQARTGAAFSINPDIERKRGNEIPLWMLGFQY